MNTNNLSIEHSAERQLRLDEPPGGIDGHLRPLSIEHSAERQLRLVPVLVYDARQIVLSIEHSAERQLRLENRLH